MEGIVTGKVEKSAVEEITTSLPKEIIQEVIYEGTVVDISKYSGAKFVNDTNRLIIFPQGKYAVYVDNIGTTYAAFKYNTFNYYTSGINALVKIDCDKQTITGIQNSVQVALW